MLIDNPHRGIGLPAGVVDDGAPVASDAGPVLALLRRCPAYAATPLVDASVLADVSSGATVHLKDERGRMGLGSFKALGAAYAIARDAVAARPGDPSNALAGRTYVTASAGNHGMSVAAGARVFGAEAVIFISETVSVGIAEKLAAKGARVVREGADYEASMAAAARAARDHGWTLLSDSTWTGYSAPARQVMAGYLAMADEILRTIPAPPTHVFLQAGVGGFAASLLAAFRSAWDGGFKAIIVEPAFAPCLQAGISAGRPVRAEGPVSAMGRLDCKEPSHVALASLARDADCFLTISEAEAASAAERLSVAGMPTTPSGAAGLAGILAYAQNQGGIDADARVLAIITEAAYD